MGYSMTLETYEKIKKLDAEGRRCCMGRCSSRSTYALTIESIDYTADGKIAHPLTVAKGPIIFGYCGKHAKQELRAYEIHGFTPPGGRDLAALRYEVPTGGGSKQVNTLLSSRKLTRDEHLTTGRGA